MIALMLQAGVAPVGVMATVTTNSGELPSPAHLEQFAAVHGLASVQVRQLVEQDLRDNPPVRDATARLPTDTVNSSCTVTGTCAAGPSTSGQS